MREPSEEELRRALVRPGFELPSSVTKSKGVILTPGLQPEDLGVLDWLKLRDPRLPATKEDLAAEMQAHGWKMGKTRFDAIFRRLKTAGHIKHHCPYNPETGRPEWVIEFYMDPVNNDQYVNSGIAASLQVRAETPETGLSLGGHSFETPETGVSPGQKESQVSRDPGGNPWKPAFPSAGVAAGQGRNAENPLSGSHPPHPPEEVDTSSPYPLTGTTEPVPSQREEEGACFAPEDLTAAAEVLQLLDKPWAVGRVKAQELAPLLLTVMREQGWPDIHAVDRGLLSAELTKNPGGARSHARLLKTDRIPDLVRYEVAARATAKPSPGGGRPGGPAMCLRHPGFEEDDCPPCRKAERERTQRGRSEPLPVNGAALLARFRPNPATD